MLLLLLLFLDDLLPLVFVPKSYKVLCSEDLLTAA